MLQRARACEGTTIGSQSTRMATSGASSTSAMHSATYTASGMATSMNTSSTGPVSSAEPYSASTGKGEQQELKLSSYNPWTPQVWPPTLKIYVSALNSLLQGMLQDAAACADLAAVEQRTAVPFLVLTVFCDALVSCIAQLWCSVCAMKYSSPAACSEQTTVLQRAVCRAASACPVIACSQEHRHLAAQHQAVNV
eukprot:GHUV01038795.1.p1 GENE.GHUV01038795.1~~GHUV01038795.1.p1  ORF type:complete len:195 (-),score=38.90 GHUV01038795.1:288-872(-)